MRERGDGSMAYGLVGGLKSKMQCFLVRSFEIVFEVL